MIISTNDNKTVVILEFDEPIEDMKKLYNTIQNELWGVGIPDFELTIIDKGTLILDHGK